MRRLAAPLLMTLALLPATAGAEVDPEALRDAKTLFFDRHYAEAREAWREVFATGTDRQATDALYWIARCSEKLGESERALAEYAEYLEAHPADRTLREEAKTSRVALAAKLSRAGRTVHRGVLLDALNDSSRTVRYFAALQMASLGPEAGRRAVPVLQEILRSETDAELVERAKLALLRLDRTALEEATPARAERGARGGRSIQVRIWDRGSTKPQLSLTLPVFLADLIFDSLPDDAREDLREEGFDARSFWERLKRSGPADILTVEGDDGSRIQVWIE